MAISSIASSSSSDGGGIDVQSTVDQILYAERAPERLMQTQQARLKLQQTALGQVQTQLATLETKINALKDINGALNSKAASSTNATVVSATASATAASGKHTLVVSRLASTSTYYSDPLSSATSSLAHGTFSLAVGGGTAVKLAIDSSNDTLSGFASYINGLNAGVTASTVSDAQGARLVLVSDKPGAAGNITVSGASMPFAMNKGADGLNAKFSLDGIPLESATNGSTDVIPGVTLNFLGMSASEVQLTIAPNSGQAKQAISDFVAAYNSLVRNINGQFQYDMGTQTAGILSGDSSIRGLQSALLNDASYSITGVSALGSLSALGVKMENDGTLTIDSTTLDGLLSTRFSDVQAFFQRTDVPGFARNFASSLDKLTDTTDGAVQLDLNGVQAQQDSISDQIEAYEVRMEMRQQVLLQQFSKIDTLLRQLPTIQAQLTSELGSLK